MRGRRASGPDYVWKLDGSMLACARLEAILHTVGGTRSLQGACSELAIAPTRFHQLRQVALQAALASLEPGQVGRPARAAEDPRIALLHEEIRQLQLQLQAANVRTELATILPRVVEDAAAPAAEVEGKKASRRRTKAPVRRRR
jgi:hypothetical protein